MNFLEARGIYVSRSSACKRGARSHVLEAMGLPAAVIDGTLRIGLSRYTTGEEMDAFCRAVYEGLPLTEKVVTVTGEGANEPKNVIVRIGTPLEELLKFAGGMKEETCKVVCGGPMMGTAQGDLSVPVVKGTNAVLCLTDPAPAAENPTCIRCGKCIKACPMGLQPLQLYRYVNAGMKDELERFNLEDCMECGCCSYVCPGRLPLVETFKAGKKLLKEGKRK